MSLLERRQQFKAALDDLEGVNGSLYEPTTPRTGDAWPVMGTVTRDSDSGQLEVEWTIAVYLPQVSKDASKWIDSHVDSIIDGLEDAQVGVVDSFEPANFGDDSNLIFGLVLTMRSNS